jgi:thiamine-phosphate diphosphorylase
MLPRLHVVTDDAIVEDPEFATTAATLLAAGGTALALHVRAPGLPARILYERSERLAPLARKAGALLQVNDRLDIALAVASGAHLARRSVPLAAARRLLAGAQLGFSVHHAEEARVAETEGADYLFLGTIYWSASHPKRAASGLALIRNTVANVHIPVIAIGGVTPDRAHEVLVAGAHGVAVMRGVWEATDRVAALREYLAVTAC